MELKEFNVHPALEGVHKNMDVVLTGDGNLHLVFNKLIIDVAVEGGKATIYSVVDNQGD